jgi:hypothetical protein
VQPHERIEISTRITGAANFRNILCTDAAEISAAAQQLRGLGFTSRRIATRRRPTV